MIRRIIPYLIICMLIAAPAIAGSIRFKCPICGAESGAFDPRDRAYMNSVYEEHVAACRAAHQTTAVSSAGAAQMDPVFAAMMPVFENVFQQFGEDLGKMIWGDPQLEAQRAEAERLRRLEMERIAEEKRLWLEQEERKRQELHKKLLSDLSLLKSSSGSSELELLPMDDDGLRPAGTSFFGLGGGKGQKPVDLAYKEAEMRKLQKAAYLIQRAYDASPVEAQDLENYAIDIIEGRTAPVEIQADALPIISEEGLKRFQKANNDYRLATDAHLKAFRNYAKIDSDFRSAMAIYEKVSGLFEKIKSANMMNPKELQSARDKIVLPLADFYDQRLCLFSEMEAASSDVSWTNTIRRIILREISAPKKPSYADILNKEREALKPTIKERKDHVGVLSIIGKAESGEVEALMWKDYRPVNDPALKARLERLLERLQTASSYPDHPKSIKIIGDPTIYPDELGWRNNCLATADTIYIGAGYLDYNAATDDIRPSDDELLFVMGHEMAHVHRNHFALAVKENIRFDKKFNDKFILESGLSDEDCVTVREAARNTMMKGFNTQQEFEADRAGAYLALAAGAKPKGITEAFNYMRSRSHAPLTSAEHQLREGSATHPNPDARQSAIEKIYGPLN